MSDTPNLIQDFNGVPGLVVDTNGGAVALSMQGMNSAADCLALTAKRMLEIRDGLLEIPNIGDWCMYGLADVNLIQLFPNADRLRNAEIRQASAEVVMGWLKGEWMRNRHTGRAAKVKIRDHEVIVVLHNVDGLLVNEPAKAPAAAEQKGAADNA